MTLSLSSSILLSSTIVKTLMETYSVTGKLAFLRICECDCAVLMSADHTERTFAPRRPVRQRQSEGPRQVVLALSCAITTVTISKNLLHRSLLLSIDNQSSVVSSCVARISDQRFKNSFKKLWILSNCKVNKTEILALCQCKRRVADTVRIGFSNGQIGRQSAHSTALGRWPARAGSGHRTAAVVPGGERLAPNGRANQRTIGDSTSCSWRV